MSHLLQSIGQIHAIAVVMKGVFGEENRLFQIDRQTKMPRIIFNRNRRINTCDRRIRFTLGKIVRMEIPARSDTQFEGDRAVAERFVDHRHIVDTTEEKKRSFQRKF